MVSRHLPDPEGTAAGRALWALGEGLVAVGHDLDVWSWWYDEPERDLPAWCRWEPLPDEPRLRTRARALVMPRSDVARARWAPPAGAEVVVADDPVSFPAVAPHPRSLLTVHYSTVLDARALGDRSPRTWQDRRAERRFSRHASGVVAYSDRVAAALPARAVFAPIGCPLPDRLPIVEEPVAACVADWTWPPNRWAATTLLQSWPLVRAELPAARLELAGAGSAAYDDPAGGVRGLGRVEDAGEVLARAAVLAFPCPPTSGPKVKVLEAMAVGLPVVTTAAGIEGIGLVEDGRAAASVTLAADGAEAFARSLVDALRDGDGRARRAAAARVVVEDHHAPAAVAVRRVRAWEEALGQVSG